jgi:hypothetical protein
MSQAGITKTQSGDLPPSVAEQFDGNTGTSVPSNHLENIFGNNTANNGYATWTIASGHQVLVNSYGTAKWVVNPIAGVGTHQTIASAVAAASDGDTIYITPGTYTENVSVSANITFAAYPSAGQGVNGTVIVVGKISNASSAIVRMSGITLQTNSDYCLDVTGTGGFVLTDSQILATNNTAIHQNNASSNIYLYGCFSTISTSQALYTITAGDMWIVGGVHGGSASGNTNSDIAAGAVQIRDADFTIPLSSSGTGAYQISNCLFGLRFTPYLNVTWLTINGTVQSFANNTEFYSGTASCISIGHNLQITDCILDSTNIKAITGLGTLEYSGLSFTNTSVVVSAGTTIGGTLQGGVVQNPSSGYIGEQIISYLNSSSGKSIASGTPTNITSISVPAGIWDISGILSITGITTGVACSISINTISATQGSSANNRADNPVSSTSNSDFTGVVPAWRQVFNTTTTVYLIGNAVYSVGAALGYGRISAVRVG